MDSVIGSFSWTDLLAITSFLVALYLSGPATLWRRWLQSRIYQQLTLGATICLLALWSLRAGIHPDLQVHFLGLTTLTLMFGWRMALWIGSLTMLLLLSFRVEQLAQLGPELLLSILMPISLSYLVYAWCYHHLPRHFFIYILVCGFLCAALVIGLRQLGLAGWLSGVEGLPWPLVRDNFLLLTPLLLFPEALLNGMALTLLVVYRPQWVSTFNDRDYLDR